MTPQEWLNSIFNNFTNIVVWPAFVTVSVVMFIWVGFLFLSAKGEPGKIDAARKALVWAVVGIVVALLAFYIIKIVGTIVGTYTP